MTTARPPRVSVLLAVYNGERFLAEAVESILAQTYGDFELIAVDDGSTDGSAAVLADYAARDARMILLPNERNIGLTRSLNRGLAKARARIVARQDADDVSLPHRLARQVVAFDERPTAVVVSGGFDFVDEDGRFQERVLRSASPGAVAWQLHFFNVIGGHSQVSFRRDAARALGGYDEARRYSQDYDLWARMSRVGDIVLLPDVLLLHRRHAGAIGHAKRDAQHAQSLENTRDALSRTLGADVPLETAALLRAFWTHEYPDPREATRVHALVKRLYHAFLRARARRAAPDAAEATLGPEIRALVSARFARWARTLLKRGSVVAGFEVREYATRWRPRARRGGGA